MIKYHISILSLFLLQQAGMFGSTEHVTCQDASYGYDDHCKGCCAKYRDSKSECGLCNKMDALYEAIVSNDFDTVKELTDFSLIHTIKKVERCSGCDSCCECPFDRDSTTPLHEAARHCHEDIIHYLIEAGADVNCSTEKGTALHTVFPKTPSPYGDCCCGPCGSCCDPCDAADAVDASGVFDVQASLSILQYLIDHGADVNSIDTWGRTPLQLAIENNARADYNDFEPVITLLKKHGGRVDANILAEAVKRDWTSYNSWTGENVENSYIVEKYVKACPEVLSAKDCEGNSLLHCAVSLKFKAITECLLEHGANPDIRDAKGKTPLYYAALEGDFDMIQLLIKHGAKVTKRILALIISHKKNDSILTDPSPQACW